MTPAGDSRPIGIMDSGVGGLSVLRHIQALLPAEDLIYFADQDHVPYGPRPAAEIREFCRAITQFLLDQGTKIIVVACNTASAAALSFLRKTYPEVPFVGMEPAVKPGAEQTNQGKIGILATEGTFGSQRYASLMARYAYGVVAYEDPCLGLVEQIEAGRLVDPHTEQILRRALEPMMAAGVDTVILGCTHYPFVLSEIERLVGPDITVIDPAPAVARQVRRLLDQYGLLASDIKNGSLRAFTTAAPAELARTANQLLGVTIHVAQARWSPDSLHLSAPEQHT